MYHRGDFNKANLKKVIPGWDVKSYWKNAQNTLQKKEFCNGFTGKS